ncbi:MAG: TadE/TadG family type IV pilus assembly protein [Rhodoblastus sp.]
MTSSNWFSRASKKFLRNSEGGIALLFAVSLVPALGAMGLAIDSTNVSAATTRIQQATDAASLAIASGMRNGMSLPEATAAGAKIYKSNLGALATSEPSITITQNGETFKAVVQGTISVPSIVKKMFASTPMSVSRASTARSVAGTPVSQNFVGKGDITGTGLEWDDPYYRANTNKAQVLDKYIDCDAGQWYNILSDGGLQINGLCENGGDSANNGKAFYKLQINVPNHDIVLDGMESVNSKKIVKNVFRVDGVDVSKGDSSAKNGCCLPWVGGPMYSVIAGSPSKFTITAASDVVAYPGQSTWGIILSNGNWNIQINIGHAGSNISVSAKTAGMCGTPGGVLGQIMSGMTPDLNKVAGPKTVGTEYNWTPICTGVAGYNSGSIARLTN